MSSIIDGRELSPAEARLWELLPGLATEFAAGAADRDEDARLPAEELRRLHALGFDRAALPRELGGEGISAVVFGAVVAEIARADPAIATTWVMHLAAGIGLAYMTAETLGDHYAQAFLRGERFANALSEPASGNRFLQPQQEPEVVDGEFRLSGAKRFVSGVEFAEHLLVNVLIDGEPTFFGVRPDESVTLIPIWDTLGLRATRSQLVQFEGTVLPAHTRSTRRNPRPNAVIQGLANISLGIARAALDAASEHARTRIIDGKPLSHQQWVQYETADVFTRIEAVEQLIGKGLRLVDADHPDAMLTLWRAKYLANKVAVEAAQFAVRIGGASGYLRRSPIQRHLRDAQAGQLMAYSTEVIAGLVGRTLLGVDAS